MAYNLQNWNVVVVGAWNRAILTPSGIQRRIFELEPTTPIEIEVAIDRPAPFRVKHNGLVVMVSGESLIVEVQSRALAHLERAATLAMRALVALPETPVVAAGINMTFPVHQGAGVLDAMLESPLDERLADEGFAAVTARSVRRTVTLKSGQLNLDVSSTENREPGLSLNLHLASEDAAELQSWLQLSPELCRSALGLAEKVFGATIAQGDASDTN